MSILGDLAAEIRETPRRQIDYRSYTESEQWKARPLLFWGALTVYDSAVREKLLDSHVWPMTKPELARAYLRRQLRRYRPTKGAMGHGKVPFRKEDLALLEVPPPSFFDTAAVGELAKVDISACYYSLYRPVTLDMAYRPGRYCVHGRVPFEDDGSLAADKETRNYVVGCARRTRGKASKYGVFEWGSSFNAYLAPGLWAYLMSVLHHVATDAVGNFGCHYWFTDGGIFPASQAERFCRYLADVWGLAGRVEAVGRGRVFGLGNYEIGDNCAGRRVGTNRALNIVEQSHAERAQARRAREASFSSAQG